jgi:hypothetical protein
MGASDRDDDAEISAPPATSVAVSRAVPSLVEQGRRALEDAVLIVDDLRREARVRQVVSMVVTVLGTVIGAVTGGFQPLAMLAGTLIASAAFFPVHFVWGLFLRFRVSVRCGEVDLRPGPVAKALARVARKPSLSSEEAVRMSAPPRLLPRRR